MTECQLGLHQPAVTTSGRPAVIRVICAKCGITLNNATKKESA